MVDKRSWGEFREIGLLWWINTILHMFGQAIVLDMEDGRVINAYPARVKFRGFDEESNDKGYYNVSKYIAENAKELFNECDLSK